LFVALNQKRAILREPCVCYSYIAFFARFDANSLFRLSSIADSVFTGRESVVESERRSQVVEGKCYWGGKEKVGMEGRMWYCPRVWVAQFFVRDPHRGDLVVDQEKNWIS